MTDTCSNQDISQTKITGLAGTSYIDKTQNAKVFTSTSPDLSFFGPVDRVYRSLPQDTTSIVVAGRPRLDVVRDNLRDTVVWNPWKEGAEAMGDFAPKDGYKRMVCVESGAVDGWIGLEAQDAFEAGQAFRARI